MERSDITYKAELTPTPIGKKPLLVFPIGVGVNSHIDLCSLATSRSFYERAGLCLFHKSSAH